MKIENKAWIFFGIIVVLYILVGVINQQLFVKSLLFSLKIIERVIPVLIMVLVLMIIVNYFVTPRMLVKWLGEESGIKGWIVAIIAGIISSGPIYMWYPLLSQLQKKGAKQGLIAVFLYNRAVKIPLMPLLIYYFGLVYTIVLTIVMIAMSIVQGLIVEKMGVKQ